MEHGLPATFQHLSLAAGIRSAMSRDPGKIAYRHGERTRSYRELVERIDRTSIALTADCGLRPGDHGAIVAKNSIEYMEIVIGASQAGVAMATFNPRLSPREIVAICDDAGARVLFTDLEMADNENDEGYVAKSGTSFAAPMLSGLTGLLWESGRRAYGEAWSFRWTEARQLAPYFSTKPADAPVKKDNAYGFGLPAMGTMLGQVSQVSAPADDMTSAMNMLMMMTMMTGMAGGI